MPGRSEICRHGSRIGGRSWQCPYHQPNISRLVRKMRSGKMPQPPLHPIACDRIPDSTTDHEANARPVSEVDSMNHQGRTACVYAAPGRLPEFLGTAHS
jgi:hypothetical protein